jgi:general secretion pathway protein B
MSFILDALKKSEQDRVRQQAPTTLELPRGTQRRVVPIWMIGVVLLLLLNCVLLLLLWLRREPVPASIAVMPAAAPVVTAPATTPVTRPTQTIRSLENEAGVTAPPADEFDPAYQSTPSTDSVTTTPLNTAPLVRVVGATSQTGEATAAVPNRSVVSGMPTLESLGGHTALSLPAIRLDLHVYSSNAKDRFVFINGKRYHEGDTTAEGVLIESITDEGAVLSSNGRRFLLPR